MSNVNIKQVEGGEVTSLGNDDGLEVDTGLTSGWIKWSSILTLISTWLTSLTATWSNKTLTAPIIADFTNAAHDHGDADDGGAVVSSSDTVAGVIELATQTEVNTGTDAVRAVTPDTLAGSNLGIRYIPFHLNGTSALTTNDKVYVNIPAGLNGMNLVSVIADCGTLSSGASSSGTPTFTVKNVTDNVQMLSTSVTIDVNEYTSLSAVTPPVIDAAHDDVATGDVLEIAPTTAGTGVTYARGMLGFQLP